MQARYDPESEQPGSGRAFPRDAQHPDARRGHRLPAGRGGYPHQQGPAREEPHWRAPNRQPHPTHWEPQVPNVIVLTTGRWKFLLWGVTLHMP